MASELLAPSSAGSLSDLSSRFDGLASRLRRVALLRGLGRLVLITTALCALGLLGDWLWPLSGAARMGWLALVIGAAGYTLWSAVLRPVFRRFTVAELAAIVESRYPELGERLTSAVELTDPAIPEDHKGSALMREWLEAETLASTRHLDFRKAVSSEHAQKSVWIGGLAAAVLLIPFLAMPSGYGALWARLLMPWGSHELPAVLYFQVPNGDRVAARGEDLTLLALPPQNVAVKNLPQAVDLVWTTASGETLRRPMEYDANQNGYVVTLPHVFEDFEYLVTAKRKRSERHAITVVDRPEIVAFTLTITPPRYTGQEKRQVDGAIGNVMAFERSRIRAELEFNKPLAEADWLWREADASTNTLNQEQASARPTALPFQLSEDKKSASLELLASQGWFSARVVDEHGLTNLEEPARNLILIADQPPELVVSGEIGTTRARGEDVVPIETWAKDDLGLSALELHIETAAGHTEVRPVPAAELGGREARQTFQLDLAALNLSDGEWVKYRARAADNRPVPGPQEVWSDERRIIIDPKADLPGSEAVVNRQNELRDVLDALRADLRKNRQDTESLKKEAETQQAQGQPFEKPAELASLENQQRELSDRLEELAARFGQHRLYANLTPETNRIAREPLKEAAEQLQKAQQETEIADQTEMLNTSELALAAAERDLEKVAKRFDELAELERDLLEVPRLAKTAERVAEQALDLAERRDNPPAEETQAQQAAREAELQREEARLDEERERLTEALDDLLKHRPEVLEAARKTALEQIAELARQAAHLADRQDVLTESLKTEAGEPGKPPANDQDPNPQRPNDQPENNGEPDNQQADASRPNDSKPNPSDPNNAKPNDSEANASRPNQSPAPAETQTPLADSPAPESTDPRNRQAAESGSEIPEGQPSNSSAENDSRPNPQRAEQSSKSNPSAGQSLMEQQAELARKSAELALKVAKDQGAASPATREATEAARKAAAAREHAQDGALDQAAKTAQEAAQAAKAAAEELASTEANTQETAELAQAAAQQAEAQEELAQKLEQAAANPAERKSAQQAGQQQLAESSEKLASDLTEAARKLASTPLDLEQPGLKTEAAGQAVADAAGEMKKAKSNAAQNNPEEAARAGEKASEALRRAADESPAPPADTPENTLVPGDLAEQVTDARRRLEEARQQLQNARKEPPPSQTAEAETGMPTDEPSSKEPDNAEQPMGDPNADASDGQGQPGQQSPMQQGQQAEGQPGEGQAAQPPSGLAQSAQSLQQAAQSLSQAAQQLQGGVPGNSNSSGQSSNSSTGQGQPSSSGSEGPGSQSAIPLDELEAELRRQNREEWGQLPGQLRTEILQGNKQNTAGDYARLIKLYSEELLKKQQAESRKN